MSGQHTLGQLTASQYLDDGRYGLLSADNEIIVGVSSKLTKEDARRLAACWNACEGIGTERLEAHAMHSSRQIDDLTAARARIEILEQKLQEQDAMLSKRLCQNDRCADMATARTLLAEALPHVNPRAINPEMARTGPLADAYTNTRIRAFLNGGTP